MKQTFVSIDVETTGQVPGVSSMLSLGAAAFSEKGNHISSFYGKLEELPGSVRRLSTMDWWKQHPEAWEEATRNAQDPNKVIRDFHDWLAGLPGRPVMIGYPITFDFGFVYWYLIRYCGDSPAGFAGLCLKTLASELLQVPFSKVSKRMMPKEWFDGAPNHDHNALNDAVGQGIMYFNMMKWASKWKNSWTPELTLDKYQSEARSTAIYPQSGSLPLYTALKLAGEAGEAAQLVGKAIRDDGGVLIEEKRDLLIKELGDVLWYVANMAADLDTDLSTVANINLEKLKSRHDRGVIQGSGDNR